ncbi:MFS transporter [Pseudonocardia ailaonensis]
MTGTITRPVASRRGRLAVAGAFLVTMTGTTLPTPLYPLYAQRDGFGGVVVTVVFATYAVGVGTALVLTGGLSDRIGRRPVLAAGLAFSLLSGLVFLVPAEPALFVGRFLSGLSAGVFTGTATAALLDLSDEGGKARAGLVASVVTMTGLGTGPLVGGVLAQFAPWPLVLPYLVHAALLVLSAGALWTVPETVSRGTFRIVPLRVGSVPPQARRVFVRASTAGFAGFAVLGLLTGVSPQVMVEVLHRPEHVAVGLVVFAMGVGAAVGQVASTHLPERVVPVVGCAVLVVGTGLIGAGIGRASLALFAAGAVVGGAGLGTTLRAGIVAVGGAAPERVRGAVVATFFLVLYTALSLPVIGVGAAAHAVGMATAGVVFSAIVGALALLALVLSAREL